MRAGQTWIYEWCAVSDATFQQVAAELEIALGRSDDNDSACTGSSRADLDARRS